MFLGEGEEILYNGIRLPEEWPPRGLAAYSQENPPVPYLDSPPPVIPIDVDRQLLADDFLVEEATLVRTFHRADKCEHNPLLAPGAELESRGRHVDNVPSRRPASAACPYDDGVFYYPKDKLFKIWCSAGVHRNGALAHTVRSGSIVNDQLLTSRRARIVLPHHPKMSRYSFPPWPDHEAASPEEHYRAFLYARLAPPDITWWLLTSSDGVH